MKKIISLLAVVSMLSLAVAMPSYAANSVTVKAEKTSIDVATYNSQTRSSISDQEYDAYKITIDYSNIGTIQSIIDASGWDPVFNGRQLTMQVCTLKFSSLDDVHTATSHLDRTSITGYKPGQWDTSSKAYVVSATGESYYYPGLTDNNTTYSDTIDDALIMYFAVKKGKTVDVELVDATLCFNECTDSAITGANEGYSAGNNNINVEGKFTLGETGSQDDGTFKFTVNDVAGPVAGTEVKDASEKVIGVVWAGCKMVNVDAVNKTYIAKFSATGYESADRKTPLKLNDKVESDGSIEFDAVMWFAGEAKTGVTMNVVEE